MKVTKEDFKYFMLEKFPFIIGIIFNAYLLIKG